MTLTPEERQRIYQEEKARLEAQGRLKAEARARATLSIPESKRQPGGALRFGFLAVIGGFLLLSVLVYLISLMEPPSHKTQDVGETSDRIGAGRNALTTKQDLLKNIGTMNTGLQ